jgi:threonine aldolase
LEPLRARQKAIGFLVALETENSKHRDYAWQRCSELCKQMRIERLNEIIDRDAAVFFTPDGTLYNTAVIDE